MSFQALCRSLVLRQAQIVPACADLCLHRALEPIRQGALPCAALSKNRDNQLFPSRFPLLVYTVSSVRADRPPIPPRSSSLREGIPFPV